MSKQTISSPCCLSNWKLVRVGKDYNLHCENCNKKISPKISTTGPNLSDKEETDRVLSST
jgi:hypothetical protein